MAPNSTKSTPDTPTDIVISHVIMWLKASKLLGESPRDDEQKHSYTTGQLNITNPLAHLSPAILV